MYRKRTLATLIQKVSRTFPAIVLTGPRQSGKTTLLRKEFGTTHTFVSLENPDVRARLLADPEGFFRIHTPPLILDEIQYVPQILPYIKSRIDEQRKPGQWILTGSQNFVLMHNVSESLAGRVAVLTLLPLGVEEYTGNIRFPHVKDFISSLKASSIGLNAKPAVTLSQWMMRGAYPEPRFNKKVDIDVWSTSYIQTYLERDVRHVINVNDLHQFQKFLHTIAARTGTMLNLSDISRDVGISVPTVQRWLSVLEASYQIYILHPYSTNIGKRFIRTPKVYMMDLALVNALVGFDSFSHIVHSPYYGQYMETVVVTEFVKYFYHRGKKPPLYYWRTRDGHEVDLLIDYNGRLIPIEIKGSTTIAPSHAATLKKWKALMDSKEKGVVVANIDHVMPMDKDSIAVPWHYLG